MPPTRRVAPIRLIYLSLFASCVLTQGLQREIQAENTALVAQSDLSFEPYSVFVAEADAFARCGPAEDYYRTDPLRQGQELEVYAETDDGWLGIRPPEKSFCWVPADTIEIKSGEQDGTVIEDRTVAWIGTHLGRARTYRWQVQLAKGEPVVVIGRSEREGPEGPQLWYRIVPPSGEYRWVHRGDIVTSSEELVELMRYQASNREVKVFPKDSPTSREDQSRQNGRTASVRSSKANRSVASSDQNQSSRRQASEARDQQTTSGPRNIASQSGDSILQNGENMVGSGLKEDWKSNQQRHEAEDSSESKSSIASRSKSQSDTLVAVDHMTRPKLLDINETPSAPAANEEAGDSNWVAGNTRGNDRTATPDSLSRMPGSLMATPSSVSPTLAGVPDPNPAGSIRQASTQRPTSLSTPLQPNHSIPQRVAVVSPERIAQVEFETRNADVDRLGLIFSRLMASQASAAETEPVARAARALAASNQDPVASGRARLLAERVDQYRRVANRRDGDSLVRSQNPPVIRASHTVPIQNTNSGPLYQGSPQAAAAPQNSTETGYLVQVYSARSNSPPFAITDRSGRTIAYVTPSPGVNLRPHLNSQVTVFGSRGYLTGLNTPHILANQAVRTQE